MISWKPEERSISNTRLLGSVLIRKADPRVILLKHANLTKIIQNTIPPIATYGCQTRPLPQNKNTGDAEDMILRIRFGTMGKEKGIRRLRTEQMHVVYARPSIVKIIKSVKQNITQCAVSIREIINVHQIGCKNMHWIQATQNSIQQKGLCTQ
jgi:hypothetical protein